MKRFPFIPNAGSRVVVFPLCALLYALCVSFYGCGGEVVHVTSVQGGKMSGLKAEDIQKIKAIKNTKAPKGANAEISSVIKKTPHFTVSEYLRKYPEAKGAAADYRVGGNDILSIMVYEEPDLTREGVGVSAKGYIPFPLIGRLKVDGLTTTEIEELIAEKLAQQQYLLDAHVSVSVFEYKSKHFMVFGAVTGSGTYAIEGQERVLDALSKVGGVDPEKMSSRAMLIRTLDPDTDQQQRIVITLDLGRLLKKGDQAANIVLANKDVLYIPPVAHFYIIGQVAGPGSYTMPENEITLVEAIGMAGGFTPIASRNKTRIIRVEDGVEKIIEVRVDAITGAGRKVHDVMIKPDDIIVVPESFF